MKKSSIKIFNIVAILLIIFLIFLIILPFNINNLEQAQRIAVWKSKYEDIKYCFSLINLYESSIVQTEMESGKLLTEETLTEKIKTYFNMANNPEYSSKRYRYRRMNGRPYLKTEQFYFNKFLKCKDGTIISVRKNESEIFSEKQPLYFMFVDINGKKKPNRIGQDIFFISIFRKHIEPLGHDQPYSALKTNCSPIASGVYCSEYYILGGRF
ncbi:hypothetical protein IJ182_02850 [bacterium]|nr:hypothetical protein [bacterium]